MTSTKTTSMALPRLAQAVRAVRDRYIATGLAPSYYQINNGQCEDFALDLIKEVRGITTGALDICNFNFMTGVNGDESENDVWDWALLSKHWGITPPAGLTADEMDQIDFGQHVWISVGRLHFDAECPQGVESFFDLPLFRRPIVVALRKKGIAADEVLPEDVVPPPLCPVPNPLAAGLESAA